MAGVVIAVSRSATHTMTKPTVDAIRLVAGLGVEGDAHQGAAVKHRSRVARDPTPASKRSGAQPGHLVLSTNVASTTTPARGSCPTRAATPRIARATGVQPRRRAFWRSRASAAFLRRRI